jgi:hypothetical protein
MKETGEIERQKGAAITTSKYEQRSRLTIRPNKRLDAKCCSELGIHQPHDQDSSHRAETG